MLTDLENTEYGIRNTEGDTQNTHLRRMTFFTYDKFIFCSRSIHTESYTHDQDDFLRINFLFLLRETRD